MPVSLAVDRFDPADDDLHGLARQRAEPIRELEDLVGFHLLLDSHVYEPNEDAEKQLVTPVRDGQDLHPAERSTQTKPSQSEETELK